MGEGSKRNDGATWLRRLLAVAFFLASAIASATDISIVGNVTYQSSGNTVVLTADRIQNNSSSWNSGTLRLELWAFDSPYTGTAKTGYKLAQAVLGTLNAGYYIQNVNTGSIPYARPPDGSWVYAFFVTEYGSDGQYTPVAWLNFPGTVTCSGGVCGNAQKFSLSVATQGNGSVTSNPAGISCPGTCSASFDQGTVVALTAQAAAGYVFSGWTGACSGSGTCTVTMSSAKSVTAAFNPVATTAKVCPANGLWAIDSEQNGQPGRGFTIESQDGAIVLTVFAYDTSGRPTFYQAVGPVTNGTFTAPLNYYSGGTSFGGAWRSASLAGQAGQVTLAFSDSNKGTITFPGEGPKSISKFTWSNSLNSSVSPTSGLWAISAEQNGQPGRGFTLEEQGGIIVLTVYGYEAGGRAMFHQSAGLVKNGSVSGNLSYYSGGTTFGGAWRSATFAGQAGPVSIAFTDSNNGTITLPGENSKAITKFNWGNTCTGGPSSPGTAPTQPPVIKSATYVLPILGVAASTGTGRLTASDPAGYPLTYSIAQASRIGSTTIDSSTGRFTYRVPGHVSASQDSFVVNVSNGALSSNATITIGLAGDPLLPNQWHIQNTGTTAFSSTLPVAGNDMNVAGAWAQGFTGQGVKVAVVDSGLEVAHEDLAANVDLASSRNFFTGTNDPSPTGTGSDHGTSVAGIIGAVAFNGKGGRGAAYGARLRGYNLLANFSLANYSAAMGGQSYSSDNDVFNASFTSDPEPKLDPYTQAKAQVNSQFITLRGGRGGILVNAAGNEFQHYRASTNPDLCKPANLLGVSCGNPAHDDRMGGTTPIIVGALNASGVKSSYSTTGASLWISAPGGEYGNDSAYAPGLNDPNAYAPAIVTTNRTGCQHARRANSLDSLGGNAQALECQYTATMNGTSSAAPNVSGVVALMLEANPRLSDRDVKYILAKTAKKVHPTQPAVTKDVAGVRVTLEQGWVANAGGYSFSNWYGFGAVDAASAVRMAGSYTDYLTAVKDVTYSWEPTSGAVVPPNSSQGVAITIPVSASFQVVEQIVTFFTMQSTPWLPCNQIELISPAGTKSILMHYATGFDQFSVAQSRMLTNAFYGEPVNGNWTLKFLDFCEPSSAQTIVTAVPAIIFAGH